MKSNERHIRGVVGRAMRGAPALTLVVVVLGPASAASAQCPGCDEYTFEVPGQGGDQQVTPEEPAAPPPTETAPPATSTTTPAAPAAPATTTATPTEPTTTETGTAPAAPAPAETSADAGDDGEKDKQKQEESSKPEHKPRDQGPPVRVSEAVPAASVDSDASSPAVLIGIVAAITAAGLVLLVRRRLPA